MCKSWCEVVLGAIILVFAFLNSSYSNWVIIVAAIILILHSFTCDKCFMKSEMPKKVAKGRR